MSDGVRLKTYIGFPSTPGTYMAVLERTPYIALGPDANVTGLGYISVVQETRGRWGSEGTDRVFRTDGWVEGWDGFDAVEWIAAQTWSNGNVSQFGGSALAITSLLCAAASPPALKAVAAVDGMFDPYFDGMYEGGVYRYNDIHNWLNSQGSLYMENEFLAHPAYDSFWTQYGIMERLPKIRVPILYYTGYYDMFRCWPVRRFTELQNQSDPSVRGKHRLIMGPWTHCNVASTTQGQFTLPGNSIAATTGKNIDAWLMYHAAGVANNVTDGGPVFYYVMGEFENSSPVPGWEWREAGAFPPENGAAAVWYLDAGLSLSASAPGGAAGNDSFAHDPANPCPHVGGHNLNGNKGPYNQAGIESRGDVLVYTSALLSSPVTYACFPEAVIYASSNALEFDIVVKITDVHPGGKSILLSEGALSSKFVDGFDNETANTPGLVREFHVDLSAFASTINAGHRIRVIISAASYNRLEKTVEPAQVVIQRRAGAASAVNLLSYP
jgi:hypothetical protein